MKVYVVTEGDCSDYHIVAIFTNKEAARIFCLSDSDRYFEEYDTDTIKVDKADKLTLIVQYDYRRGGSINGISLGQPMKQITMDADCPEILWMSVDMSSDKRYKSVIQHGNESRLLQKVVHDKFAEYLYEQGMNKNELYDKRRTEIEEEHSKRYARLAQYLMASSSSSFLLEVDNCE